MTGVARDYCMGLAQSKEYRALVQAVKVGDELTVGSLVDSLTARVEKFAADQATAILEHDRKAELSNRRVLSWHRESDPGTLGHAGAAFERYIKPFRPRYPRSLASPRQFLEGLGRQLEHSVPILYEKMDSHLKNLPWFRIAETATCYSHS